METLDILSHHFDKTPDEMRRELHQRNLRNLSFVHKVGWYILQKKKLVLLDYINTMAIATTPLDEIALVLITWMYKVHIVFLVSEKYWTTQRNHDISKFKIVLAFRGNLTFNDTRKRPKTPPSPPPSTPTASYRLWSTTQNERNQQKKPKVITVRIDTRIQTKVNMVKL